MKVRAVKSFGGSGGHYPEGAEFDLPAGVDWLQAGLVVPVESTSLPKAKPRQSGTGSPTKLPGIGDSYADQLRALGITNIAELATADEATLTSLEGVGPATAKRWQQAARDFLRGE